MNNLKIPLNYGTIAGIAVFIVYVLNFLIGFNPFGNASWLAAWVPFVFIYLTIKNVSQKEFNGYISYWQAVRVSVVMVLIYATLGNMLNFIFFNFAAPHVFDEFINLTLEELEKMESFLGAEMYEKMVEEFEKTTLTSYVFSNTLNQILGGTILALIFAGFMKKNRSIFETPTDEQN
jgi:hypothetical protein